MSYTSPASLIAAFSGAELLQLAWPETGYSYLGISADAAALPGDWPGATAGDAALALAEDALYGFDGSSWDALDPTRLTRAITAAANLINGYLRPRHALPLGQAVIDDSALPDKAAAIVRYELMDDQASEECRNRYRDAIAWLKELQAGRVSLGEQDSAPPAAAGMTVAAGSSGYEWETF